MALTEESYGSYGKADFNWDNVSKGASTGMSVGGPVGGIIGGIAGGIKSYSDKINLERGYTYSSPWKTESNTISQEKNKDDSVYADPMSVFGTAASTGLQQYNSSPTTLYGSAMAGIQAQEDQRNKIKELYAPFYESAITGGLSQLQALATGGDVDYTPSKLYEYSKERGERNIKRTQAYKGQLDSSATQEKLSDLNLGLASEEMDRLYQGQLSRVQLGAGAADAVGSANRSLGNNVASLYSSLGSTENALAQDRGSARQSAYQGLSSTLMGIAKYMES